MSHFAELNDDNKVLRVIAVESQSDDEAYNWVSNTLGGRWIQTSYNGNIRKHFAGTGFTYNEALDVFLPPKPYDSWVLNEETVDWEAPIPMPEDGYYFWNEETLSWEEVE
jgi:hypothetical protein